MVLAPAGALLIEDEKAAYQVLRLGMDLKRVG